MLIDSINNLLETALPEIKSAADLDSLEKLRIRFLGKQGELTAILKQMQSLSVEEKKSLGAVANKAKKEITSALDTRLQYLKEIALEKKLEAESIDVSLPGRGHSGGSLHPVTLAWQRAVSLLSQLGFTIAEGPEIEDDYHNFAALNMPANHPARDMQDTFYFDDGSLLRTHTSSVQIRTMKKQQPPLRIITPGRVYRRDSDQTHTPMFHQLEGLLVDDTTNFLQLQATLRYFLRAFFDMEVAVRFRPSYFPFTEPSAEVDIAFDPVTGRVSDKINNDTKWLEVLGCGMVHPLVLQQAGVDPESFQGFAFGVGLDRLAMLRYGIDDLRSMFEHDVRFLAQFTDIEGLL